MGCALWWLCMPLCVGVGQLCFDDLLDAARLRARDWVACVLLRVAAGAAHIMDSCG